MAVNSFNAQNPPVNTKGDLFTFSTIPTKLGVGANNTVLTADSTTATGLKWAAPASGGDNWVLISSQSVSAVSSVSFTGLTGYKRLFLAANNWWGSASTNQIYYRLNADSGANYLTASIMRVNSAARNNSGATSQIIDNWFTTTVGGGERNSIGLMIEGCNGGGYKPYTIFANGWSGNGTADGIVGSGVYYSTSNISSINITLSAGTITSSSGNGNEFQLWGVA